MPKYDYKEQPPFAKELFKAVYVMQMNWYRSDLKPWTRKAMVVRLRRAALLTTQTCDKWLDSNGF